MDTKNTMTWTTLLFIVFVVSAVMIYNNLISKYNKDSNNIPLNNQYSEQQSEATAFDTIDDSLQKPSSNPVQESAITPDKHNNAPQNPNNSDSQNENIPTEANKQDNTDTTQSSDVKERNEEGKAPDFKVYDINGNTVSLYSLRGKPIVLNFWASWCGPCKSEMPHFYTAYQNFKDEVTFVMVNMTDGMRETQQKAQNYLYSQSYSFPVYFDKDRDAAYTYSVSGIPTTVFIDKDGYIVKNHTGLLNENTLLNYISRIK